MLALPDDEIHLWICSCEQSISEELLSTYRTLLTSEETAQCERFRFAADRRRFLLTRSFERYSAATQLCHRASGDSNATRTGARRLRSSIVGCRTCISTYRIRT